MPFPSSEEGLESLLVIQPHLSWSRVGVGGAPPRTRSSTNGGGQRSGGGRRGQRPGQTAGDPCRPQETPGDPWRPLETPGDPCRPQETPGDPWRPSVVWPSTPALGRQVQDWLLILGVLASVTLQINSCSTTQKLSQIQKHSSNTEEPPGAAVWRSLLPPTGLLPAL